MRTWTTATTVTTVATTALALALMGGCGSDRGGRDGEGGGAGGGELPIEARCADIVLDPDATGAKAAFWNQKDVDAARHLVSQQRSTDLSLSIHSARAVERSEATVVRTEWNAAQAVSLDEEGRYSVEDLPYSASSIDVLLADDHFTPAPAVAGVSGLRRTLLAHWYHPGAWFEAVRFDLDVTEISAEPVVLDDGRIAVRLRFPEGTVVAEAVGSVEDSTEMLEASAEAGGALIPFEAGSQGGLALSVTLTPGSGVISADDGDGQDPPPARPTYRRCVGQADGDPYGHVLDVTPHSDVQIVLSFDFAPAG